jgi:hypothetical protein
MATDVMVKMVFSRGGVPIFVTDEHPADKSWTAELAMAYRIPLPGGRELAEVTYDPTVLTGKNERRNV